MLTSLEPGVTTGKNLEAIFMKVFSNLKSQKRKERGCFLALITSSHPLSTREKEWRDSDLNASPRLNLTGPDQCFPSNKLYCFQ